MELFTLPYYSYHLALCILLALLYHAVLRAVAAAATRRPRPKLPPGPWQLPIIGSLHHLLRGLPHHIMRDLSLRHGPLMLLRVCEREAIVVSSAEAAREMYKGNEAAFSTRLSSPGIDELSRHGQGIVFAPYGDHWRLLHRILVTELLSARRVEAFRRIREEEAGRLLSSLQAEATCDGRLVDIGERLEEFVTDSVVRAIFGDRLPDRATFLRIVKQGVDLSSIFDLRDLFPSSWLVRLVRRRGGKAERQRQEVLSVMDSILKSHEERRAARDGNDEQEQDMVQVLLRIQKDANTPVSLTDGVIRTLLIEVFGAALDTTATTLEWAMAELMANPRVMRRVQSEVDCALAGQATVQEVALKSMQYLRAVIKETLRLHPPATLLARVCVGDCKIQGYDVTRGMIVLTNTWAISRDPKYWDEPDKFMPERFDGEGVPDLRGMDFEFTPFGVGRRICPGIEFAYANLEIALASLLYHFNWELPLGVEPGEVDMTEEFGVTARRKVNLFVRPIIRVPLR
ncbi:zealexin A1 synthase-like [Triticum dicoccoides]|uniref:zealexin A1 synthase-like n=1 Tax=Triticum dicoccoides TaxID=85692 RepID=UPI001890A054|nr:zealexin A1 synthase-like [Triticum dicoccoides]